MLLSALISLTATNTFPILGPLGRPAQAWFLGQVTRWNPSMAAELHDGKSPKPYTVSTLLDDYGRNLQPGSWLHEGQTCWLRLTTFGNQLSALTLDKLLPNLPNRLTFYKMQFRIDGYTFDRRQHPWAGRTTFQDLAQDAALVKASTHVRLEFTSPTAFRSDGRDVPLPSPGLIFRSYWQKWNEVVPEEYVLQDVWPEFARGCIYVDELTAINTQKWIFGEVSHGSATGYTGTAGFYLLDEHKTDQWRDFYDGAAAVMQSLSLFSFYCGTGHHTTIGMGQTRLLD